MNQSPFLNPISPIVSGALNFSNLLDYDGYIVEFTDPPAAVYAATQLSSPKDYGSTLAIAQVTSYKTQLSSAHQSAKSAIASKLDMSDSQLAGKTGREFYNTFNGLSMKLTDAEAAAIRTLQSVKSVSPNYKVNALLMDAVPLVGADQVWVQDADGNSCIQMPQEDCPPSSQTAETAAPKTISFATAPSPCPQPPQPQPCITGAGVTIAVIDTGVDYTHPDLGGCLGASCKVIGGYDFVNNDADPMDDNGHGTHVASTAAGNGTLKGIAPSAKILAYKVLSQYGGGYTDDILASIDTAIDPNNDSNFSDHADIISMSIGGIGGPDSPLSVAADNAVDAGVIVVVAAGNSGPAGNDGCRNNILEYQSGYESICAPGTSIKAITVGATYEKDYAAFNLVCTPGTETRCGFCYSGSVTCDYWGDASPVAHVDTVTSFSSRGAVVWQGGEFNKPDIVAPGAIICAARYDTIFPDGTHPYYKQCLDAQHVQMAGTSMATPIVSGAAALLKQAFPAITPQQVKMVFKSSANNLGLDPRLQGAGRLSVTNAMSVARSMQLNSKPELSVLESNPSAVLGPGRVSVTVQVYNIGFAGAPSSAIQIKADDGSTLYSGPLPAIAANSHYAFNASISVGRLPLSVEITVDPSGAVSEYSEDNNKIVVQASVPMLSGWPKKFPWSLSSNKTEINGLFINTLPTVGDLDASYPGLEIVFAVDNATITQYEYIPNSAWLYAYHHDGTSVSGWPIKVADGRNSYFYPPVIADADPSYAGKEVIFSTFPQFTYPSVTQGNYSYTYMFHADGSRADGWPIKTGKSYLNIIGNYQIYVPSLPAVADIDKAYPGLEVIQTVFASEGPDGYNGTRIHAWHTDGTNVSGWPVLAGYYVSLSHSSVAADINNDGSLEILYGGTINDRGNNVNGTAFAFYANGSAVADWPFNAGFLSNSPGYGDLGVAAVGDVDPFYPGLEAVFYSSNAIYLLHADGALAAGWPREFGTYYSLGGALPPLIADINGDSSLEILFSQSDIITNTIHALKKDGTELAGYPKRYELGSRGMAAPTVSDLDSTSAGLEIIGRDVVLRFSNRILAAYFDGSRMAGSPIFSDSTMPAIADINNDGRLELAVTSYDNSISIYAMPQTSSDKFGWPKLMHDAWSTSNYGGLAAIELLSPANGFRTTDSNATLSYRAYSSTGEPMQCTLSVDAGIYAPGANFTDTMASGQTISHTYSATAYVTYWWTVKCKVSGNLYSQSPQRNFILNNLNPPNVTLVSPANNTVFSNGSVMVTYSVSNLQAGTSCQAYVYVDNVDKPPVRNVTSPGGVFTYTDTYLAGSHSLFVLCTRGGNVGRSETRAFSINGAKLISPVNNYVSSSSSVALTYGGYYSGGGTLSCQVFVNGVQKSSANIASGSTATYSATYANGQYSWYARCYYSAFSGTSETKTFTVSYNPPPPTCKNCIKTASLTGIQVPPVTGSAILALTCVLVGTLTLLLYRDWKAILGERRK